MSTRAALLFGALTVGTLDILDAIVFFGIRNHAAPIRIFQSIAAGLLGRAAFAGGLRTALLGALLHYFIAFSIVAVFFLLSRAIPVLRQRAVVSGILYGVGVYLFMNFVVLPLSNAGRGPFVLPAVINAVLIHMFGVGVPAALFARSSRSASRIRHHESLITNH